MVEWKTLGDIGKCMAGATPSTKERSYWENGTIPWMSSGEVHQEIVTYTASFITQAGYDNASTKLLPIGTIVIALAGQGKTRGSVAITNIELCTNQSLCGVVIDNDKIVNKFVFYYLKTRYDDLRRISSGEGTRGGLNLKMIGAYPIPIPSYSEQTRIVGILDTFTASIENLKQQIAERRKQYEHYRDQLLDLEGKEGVEMKTLGDILISLKTGLNPRKNFVLNSPGSNNYYITVRELGMFEILPVEKTDKVTDEALKLINNRSNLEVGDVLFSGTGTIGRTALVKEPPINWNIKEGVYSMKPCIEKISPRYLIQLLHTNSIIDRYSSLIVGDPIRSIPMKSLLSLCIPVPSLSEQSRIVSILNTFEASIANLEEQLKEREKQYEYYRNKLLTFD